MPIEYGEANEENTKRLKEILHMTTKRRYELVTGRIQDDGALFPIQGEEGRQKKDERLIEMLDSVDVRGPLKHIERGCCANERECRQKMYTALMEGGLMITEHFQLPSKHRVGSMASSNADQVAGYMICNALIEAILQAFGRYGDGDPGNENSED